MNDRWKPEDMQTWRHADGTIRVDHMDAQLGDYYGEHRNFPITERNEGTS